MLKKSVGQMIKNMADELGFAAEYIERLESTNDYARKSSADLIVTDHQTKGRGRGDHQWICPKDGDYFLTTWIITSVKQMQPIFAPLVGLALYHSLQTTWPSLKNLSLKAPNDIYLGHRKLAGILIESFNQATYFKTLVGIGINVFSHPPNLSATSLAQSGVSIKEQHIKCLLSCLQEKLYFEVSKDAVTSKLTLQKRLALKQALNQHPDRLNQKRYTDVLPDGSLQTYQETIPWQDI